MRKRVIALLLTLTMVLGLTTVSAWAGGTADTGGTTLPSFPESDKWCRSPRQHLFNGPETEPILDQSGKQTGTKYVSFICTTCGKTFPITEEDTGWNLGGYFLEGNPVCQPGEAHDFSDAMNNAILRNGTVSSIRCNTCQKTFDVSETKTYADAPEVTINSRTYYLLPSGAAAVVESVKTDSPPYASYTGVLPGTVTLTITPEQEEVSVGANSDVYVTFTAQLSFDGTVEIPAFSFVLKPAWEQIVLATQTQLSDENFYYAVNPAIKEDTGASEYGYTAGKRYMAMGGTDTPLRQPGWVMKMMVKFPAGCVDVPADCSLFVETDPASPTDVFTAGQENGDQYTRIVQGAFLRVTPGVPIWGRVRNEAGDALADAEVALYQNGAVLATATSLTDGSYSFENLSTGQYSVRTSYNDGALKASAPVTVTATSVERDLTVRPGVEVSGTVSSWNNTDDAIIRLYPGATEDAVIKTDVKLAQSAVADTVDAAKGTITVNSSNNKKSDQTYSFETIPEGSYKLAVYKPGKYVVKIVPVTVDSDDVAMGEQRLWLCGDVTGDGVVTVADATQIKRYGAGKSSMFTNGTAQDTADRLCAADITGDGVATVADATQIMRYGAGKSSMFNSMV